jgi:rhamnogalacturonyl hydrolase YesR
MNALLSMQRCSWEQGYSAIAMMDAGETELVIAMAYDAVLHQSADSRLAMIGSEHVVTDTGANGEPVLFAYEHTGNCYYKEAADRLLDYFQNHAPKSDDGTLYHFNKSLYEGYSACQIWSDSCFMAPPQIPFECGIICPPWIEDVQLLYDSVPVSQ